MDSLSTLTAVLGWCTVLNLGMLASTGVLVMVMRDSMTRIVPYVALKIVT